MKHRPAPAQPNFDRSLHTHPDFQRQFKRWAQRLTENPEVRPEDLPAGLYDFVSSQLVLQRGGRAAQSHYERERVAMTPVLSVPENDDPLGDLHLMFALPEMQDFWRDWTPQLSGSAGQRRGPKANWASAKATLAVTAMTGVSSHLRDGHQILAGRSPNRDLLVMFESLERLAQQRAEPSLPGIGAAPVEMKMASEQTVTRLVARMAAHTIAVASRTRLRLLLSLQELHPRVGERWLIDSTDVPAWTRQVGASGGAGTDADIKLRGRCPQAGHRIYKRQSGGPGGKTDVQPGDYARPLLTQRIVKAWRGYYLTALMDQATGLFGPLTVYDASVNEDSGIVPLLSLLYRQAGELYDEGLISRELKVKELVGDSAWDYDPWCKLCLVEYGIDPIFRLHNPKGRLLDPGESRDQSIKGITGTGQMVCQAHGKPLDHGTLERPSRNGLLPGQATDERKFRVRAGAQSPCGCGRLSLGSRSDWSALVLHPHHPLGRPDLYGHRKAALDTLQQIESGFNSLKTGRKVANGGEERTRLLDMLSVHALIELAALSQVALAVVDQRQIHGAPLSLAVPTSGSVKVGDGSAEPLRKVA